MGEQDRSVLGGKVAAEAFQLFRLLGFDSFAEAMGLDLAERDDMQHMAGLAMGRALVRRGALPAGELEPLLDAFRRFYHAMGLGVIQVETAPDGVLHVGIAECAGCHGADPVGRPICHVEAGMICGVFSEATGADYAVQEIRCIGGMGDQVCEFALTRK